LMTGKVISVESFDGVVDGPGQVVVTTYERIADAETKSGPSYRLDFDGVKAPLFATDAHPLYSLDRDDWVQVRYLQVGERLQTAEGAVAIAALERVRHPDRVYNLEIEYDHEYFVGEFGVRAHNACGNKASSSKAQHGYMIVDTNTNKVVKVGVSGGKLTKGGASYRANRQVYKWNVGNPGRYRAKVVKKIGSQKNARRKILDWEKKRAHQLRKKGHLKDPTKHKRP
ncbi:MAG: polymorphic toxin-type HINT domain-containing protein, partial [Myxococcota bacterium]